ncbi:MAG: hypothetical protein ACKVZJ_14050 [Phycisphaerales bacterium]
MPPPTKDEVLRRCTTPPDPMRPDARAKVPWLTLFAALKHVCADRSEHASELLRQVARYDGPLPLADVIGAPHIATPNATLRAIAVSELAARADPQDLELLATIAFAHGEEHVRSIARHHFRLALEALRRSAPPRRTASPLEPRPPSASPPASPQPPPRPNLERRGWTDPNDR